MAVLTFVKQGISTLEVIFERMEASSLFSEGESEALRLFDVEELERYLSQAGFKGFAYDMYEPSILFHAEKG